MHETQYLNEQKPLGGRLRYFLCFFGLGDVKGESGATGTAGGFGLLLKIPGGGGGISQEGGGGEGATRVSAGNLGAG